MHLHFAHVVVCSVYVIILPWALDTKNNIVLTPLKTAVNVDLDPIPSYRAACNFIIGLSEARLRARPLPFYTPGSSPPSTPSYTLKSFWNPSLGPTNYNIHIMTNMYLQFCVDRCACLEVHFSYSYLQARRGPPWHRLLEAPWWLVQLRLSCTVDLGRFLGYAINEKQPYFD